MYCTDRGLDSNEIDVSERERRRRRRRKVYSMLTQ